MADANPIELDIPPGVVLTLSELGVRGRWNRTEHIRFVNTKAEKIGGWQNRCPGEFLDGLARGSIGWVSSSRLNLFATGTATKLYSISDHLQDITPLRAVGTFPVTDPFSATSGSPIITVTHVGHELDSGATVNFPVAKTGPGVVVSGPYVVAVLDNDHYTIVASTSATSTATFGGTGVSYEYEINPGSATPQVGTGWGAGAWGEGAWGMPKSSGTISGANDLRVWSFDRYGDHLLVGYTNGFVYLWDEKAAADRIAVVVNSPICRFVFLTAERFIFALGVADQPMALVWPDRDDITNWTPSDFSEASGRVLQDGNLLMAGTIFNDSVNLIWSDSCIYRAQYIPGATFFYDIAPIALECGLISQDGWESTPSGVVWMSTDDFFIYNGQVVAIPNRLDVRDWVFNRMRRDQAGKIWCGYNPRNNEAWWGIPMGDSMEPDMYVKVCLDDFVWDVGTLTRTTMAAQKTPTGDIIMCGTDSVVYNHETGLDADGAILESFIGHAAVSVTDSDTDIDLMGYQPDFERQAGVVTLEIELVDRPMSREIIDSTVESIAEGQGVVDLYLGGRYARSLLRSKVLGGDFRLGIGHFELAVAGEE